MLSQNVEMYLHEGLIYTRIDCVAKTLTLISSPLLMHNMSQLTTQGTLSIFLKEVRFLHYLRDNKTSFPDDIKLVIKLNRYF